MLRFCLVALVVSEAFAAPANSSQSPFPFVLAQETANASLISQFTAPWSAALINATLSVASTSCSDIASPTLAQLSVTTSPLSFSMSSFSPSSTSLASQFPSAVLVTKVVTDFETTTVALVPSVTIVTVFVTALATATVTPFPSPPWGDSTQWAAPPQMTDLSAFNITHFPSGQRNLRIVAQIPPQYAAATSKCQTPTLPPNTTSAILQLVYPAHSVNPGSRPEGGAGFYATPLDLAGARNVTLEYSVFFPADFDWVKGGKLPGLFGGHTGCSGGSSARDCFSTRLMWRPQGAGELYLYAPKDKQTASLCADRGSVCDSTYGFSVGRGAFDFAAGDWTHLRQNVVLNTPGRNDGLFTLFVDGRPKINRTDIFYRSTSEDGGAPPPAEFLGLFFSTFFGGHGKRYATPRQQYTWFKDFVISRHD